jgi:hypothetical protein
VSDTNELDRLRADQIDADLKYRVMQYLVGVRDYIQIDPVSIEQQIATILNMGVEANLVARILPEPVEVWEFWRATVHAGENGDQVYDDLAWQCDTRQECIETAARACRNVRQESATIEHVRETIISREKVQP